METAQITSSLTVAGQIDEHDVDSLAAAGFKSVICQRPDSEGGTPSDRIRAACERHGMKFFYEPVVYAKLSVVEGDTFGQILEQCDEPAFVYCRTGHRSTGLWAITAAPFAGPSAVVQRAARIGFKIDDLGAVLVRSAMRNDLPYASSDAGARERFERLWINER